MAEQSKAKTEKADGTGVATLSKDERRRVPLRERQNPSLYDKDKGRAVEVAERTQDTDKPTSQQFVKVFVTLKRDYDIEGDAVHDRNKTAVRQFMVNQGLRPDADVEFVGAEDHWDGKSVCLKYAVSAVPAAVATAFDEAHTVIPHGGPTPTERAEHDAKRADRLRIGYDAKREGTPEAERPAQAR